MSKILIDTNILVYAIDQDSMAIFLELVSLYQPKGSRVHDIEIISIGLANRVYEVATFNAADFKSIREISLVSI